MSKHEGKSIGSLAGLGEAFEGQALPAQEEQAHFQSEPIVQNEDNEPVAETEKTAGDLIIFNGQQYIFHGYDKEGHARLYDETRGVPREAYATREQLLEGFRLAKEAEARVDAGVAVDIEEAIKMGEVDASARMLKDVASGASEPLAVKHEVERDINEVELVIKQSNDLPTPEQEISLPIAVEGEPAPVVPEGEVAQEDKAERAKQLQEEAERALALDGEIRALNKKHGTQHEVAKLYEERDRLNEHIHGLLKEIVPEALSNIKSEDFATKKPLSSDPTRVQAYHATQKRRNDFLAALTKIGLPRYVATKIYHNEAEAIHDFKQITERAEAGDKRALSTKKARRLLARFGGEEAGAENLEQHPESKEVPPIETSDFAKFTTRGNNPKLTRAVTGIESGTAPQVAAQEQSPVQSKPEASATVSSTAAEGAAPVLSEESAREVARLEWRMKNSGFTKYSELVEAKKRLAELKAGQTSTTTPSVQKNAEKVPLTPEKDKKIRERYVTEGTLITTLENNIQKLAPGSVRTQFEEMLAVINFARNKTVNEHNEDPKFLVALQQLLRQLSGIVEIEMAAPGSHAPIRTPIGHHGLKSSPEVLEAEIMPQGAGDNGKLFSKKNEKGTEEAGKNIEIKKQPISASVIEKFGNEGVSLEELQEIQGFSDLSEGKQLLLLKNYSTAVVNKIKSGAKKEADTAWEKRTFLGKAGLTIITLGMAKTLAEKATQRDIARKLSSGEQLVAKERRAMLEAFTKVAEEGPEVEKSQDGSLQLNYLSTERFKDNPEALAVVNAYNAAAATYAKIPKQWIDADVALTKAEQPGYFAKLLGTKNLTVSGKEHLQVAESKDAYHAAREQLLALLEKQEGGEVGPEARRRAMLELNGLDERVQLNQLFASNPDAEEALQDIRDSNTFTRTASEFVKNRGQYMAYGMATRIAAVAAIGAIALPATAAIAGGAVAVGVAGAVGYFQSRREARELLKTRRASGMLGDAELQEDVVYTVKNEEELSKKEAERDAAFARGDQKDAVRIEGIIRTLRENIKAGNFVEHRTKKLREFRDAKFYTDRVERLLTKLDVAQEVGDKDSADAIERKIAQTATLMRELMQQGMLSFGQESRLDRMQARAEGKHLVARADDSRSAINGLAFMQALGHADAAHSLDMAAIETKLGSVIGGYRKDIDASARTRSNKHIAKAVALRVGFGLAGYGLMHAGANLFGGHGFEGSPTTTHGPDWGEAHQADWGEHGSGLGQAASHAEAALGAHTVTSGETLTAIVRKFPEIAKLPHHSQEVAIANLMKHLSPEQLKVLGISSGNVNMIRVGEHIDLNKLHEQLVSIKVGGHSIVGQVGAAHSGPVSIPGADHMSVGPVAHEATHGVTPSHSSPESVFASPSGRAGVGHGASPESVFPPKHIDEHIASLHGGDSSPEIVAIAQNKLNRKISEIFGQKTIFGRDHMKEWEGDTLRKIHGLKDASAESLLSRHRGLLSETRTHASLRGYMQELSRNSQVRPRTGETAAMYIKRALLEEENVARHTSHASTPGLRSFSTAEHVPHVAPPPAEALQHIESVHSTDEALNKVMPQLMKMPEIANADEGVRINLINNVLRGAKPQHYQVLGISPEDGQKFLGQGHLDIAKVSAYIKSHQGAPASIDHVAAASPEDVVNTVHLPPLSHENVLAMEKQWDVLSEVNKAEAAARMVPDYAKHEIAAHVKGLNVEKFMQQMEKLPVKYLYESKEELLKHVDPQTAEGIVAVHDIALQKHFIGPNAGVRLEESLATFVQNAYIKRMLEGGPAAVK